MRSFFRTNRATCWDWLLRVRLLLIRISAAIGQHAVVVHHAHHLLNDMVTTNKQHLPSFEQVVRYAATALCHLRCPEAILGLHAWCKNVTGKRAVWIKAMAEKAAAR